MDWGGCGAYHKGVKLTLNLCLKGDTQGFWNFTGLYIAIKDVFCKNLTIITPKTPEMYVLLCCAGKPVPDNFTAAPHLLRHSPCDVILAIPPDPASNEAVSVSLLLVGILYIYSLD